MKKTTSKALAETADYAVVVMDLAAPWHPKGAAPGYGVLHKHTGVCEASTGVLAQALIGLEHLQDALDQAQGVKNGSDAH